MADAFNISRRGVLGIGAGLMASAAVGMPAARAAETVQIGLATRTWYPSVIAEAALRQGLFEEEGIEAVLTVYQSGAEAFTAMAAGAADVVSTAPNAIATGRQRGVDSKIIAATGTNNFGWHLMVPPDSDIQDAEALDGMKVGITSAGSLSDALAKWTMQHAGVSFETIPLGGGGLVPNLLAGNVDAVVVYSPLSFEVLQNEEGRSILAYASAMPEHLNAGWGASDAAIADKADLVGKTLRALYGGVAHLQENREAGIALVAEINDIPESVAAEEYENVILKSSTDGSMTLEQAKTALELARIAGITDLAPAEDIFTTEFTPVSTGS